MTGTSDTMRAAPAADNAALADLFPAGTRIGEKYVVTQVLGAGGMGVVLEARHEALGELVAIKTLRPNTATSAETLARFLREGRAARKLKSEHAVRIHDVGTTASGHPFMVMERLEGLDLATLASRRGQLPVPEAVGYVVQGCEALAEAHAAGFVHRDIKPSNLFLTQGPDGSPLVKVLDFGIVKTTTGEDYTLTATSTVFGSPAYMSPEQIRSSKNVDARADIWSIGVLLYELLTARSPFDGESSMAIIASITADPPAPVEKYRTDVPEGLSAAIFMCLEKDPARRPQSIQAVASLLEPFAPSDAQPSFARIRRISSRTMSAVPASNAAPAATATIARTTGKAQSLAPAVPARPSRVPWTVAVLAIAVLGGVLISQRVRVAGRGAVQPDSPAPRPSAVEPARVDPPQPAIIATVSAAPSSSAQVVPAAEPATSSRRAPLRTHRPSEPARPHPAVPASAAPAPVPAAPPPAPAPSGPLDPVSSPAAQDRK